MDIVLTIIGVIVLVLIAWWLLKFVLKLTSRVIGCAVTALIAIGIVAVGLVIIL
ncbi:MAG TPA: hypothetical protein VMZ24_04040 [Patescibacteria group bacterium]|nr:hypothetical protein [Patescibacteria group bacterium]